MAGLTYWFTIHRSFVCLPLRSHVVVIYSRLGVALNVKQFKVKRHQSIETALDDEYQVSLQLYQSSISWNWLLKQLSTLSNISKEKKKMKKRKGVFELNISYKTNQMRPLVGSFLHAFGLEILMIPYLVSLTNSNRVNKWTWFHLSHEPSEWTNDFLLCIDLLKRSAVLIHMLMISCCVLFQFWT